MHLPKLVNSLWLIVNSKKTTHYPLPTTHSKLKHGFSLIELLIVISIIGILVAAGTVSWQNAQVKGRDGKRKADIKAIQQALELYFQANGAYAPSLPYWQPDDGWCAIVSSTVWPQFKQSLTTAPNTYISVLPSDPLPSRKGTLGDYVYGKSNKNHYTLYAALENPKDLDINGSWYLNGCAQGDFTYNFQVMQP